MKTTFRIIVMVLVAAFYGCQKSDISLGVSSSISSDGLLSGTIVNDTNRIDSIKAYGYSSNNNIKILGKSAVSSSGKFSLELISPVRLSKFGTVSGVVSSDTTAMVGTVSELDAYKGGINVGSVFKGNLSLSDSTYVSQFWYSDRTFTIKGTEIRDTTYNGITYNSKFNNNITFKKGWNEIVSSSYFHAKTSTNSITVTSVETFSNTVTADLQWRFSPSNSSSIRAKAHGIKNSKNWLLNAIKQRKQDD